MTATLSNAKANEPRTLTADLVARLQSPFLPALIFSLKTVAAALIALYISFWLGLDEPKWALLTVFIVSQPDSGLVLAKSFYRILGSIAGVLASIVLVFAFAQYGVLFLASLAIWIGLCNFAARAGRNFASYGFLLAGYTVAVVGLPAALNPGGAYPLFVARFTEISLGIACAALVSRLVFPGELAPKLERLVRDLALRAERFAAAAADPAADRTRRTADLAQFAKDVGAAEAMRASAFFESADARLIIAPVPAVIDAALDLCAVAAEAEGRRPRPGQFAAASLPTAEASLAATDDTPRGNGAAVAELVSSDDERAVSAALARLRNACVALDRRSSGATPTAAGRLWSDPIAAALTGLRSALAVAITSAFWFATAWPSGPTAIVIAAVVCSLLASMERPEEISLAADVTLLVAAVPVFMTLFYLMPLASDFPSMAVALAPLLLTGGFIIAQPKIGPLGLLSVVYFATASNIDNVMSYDAAGFLNTSLADLLGIGVAMVMFSTFFPENPRQIGRRFRKFLLLRLRQLAGRRDADVQAYERAIWEQLAMTLERVKDDPMAVQKCLVGARLALSMGHAIDRLRTAASSYRIVRGIAAALEGLMCRISLVCSRPSRASLTKCAWDARALRRRSLAMARAANGGEEIELLAAMVSATESLRSNLLKARMLVRDNADVR